MEKKQRTQNSWVQYVRFFRESNPELSYKEAMREARPSYLCLKQIHAQNGGFNNIDLQNPQLRFEAGVSALNSGLEDIGRPIKLE